eukprot:jgi/Chrzof1/13114/Cz07g20120.t1
MHAAWCIQFGHHCVPAEHIPYYLLRISNARFIIDRLLWRKDLMKDFADSQGLQAIVRRISRADVPEREKLDTMRFLGTVANARTNGRVRTS